MTQPSHPIAVDFHGARLLGIPSEAGVMVPLRPLVEGMGLDWSAQFRRAQRDPILANAACVTQTNSGTFVAVTATNPQGAGDPEAICLPLRLVPGFLFGINANRVAPELRAKVIDYQLHCYDVLADAFLGRRGAARDAMPARPTDAACASLLNAVARLVPNVGDNYACYWPDLPKALGPAQPGWPQPRRLKGWLEINAPDFAMVGIKAMQFGTAYMRGVSFTRTAVAVPLPEISSAKGMTVTVTPSTLPEPRP